MITMQLIISNQRHFGMFYWADGFSPLRVWELTKELLTTLTCLLQSGHIKQCVMIFCYGPCQGHLSMFLLWYAAVTYFCPCSIYLSSEDSSDISNGISSQNFWGLNFSPFSSAGLPCDMFKHPYALPLACSSTQNHMKESLLTSRHICEKRGR